MPYKCEICGKETKSGAGLSGHKQIAHAAVGKAEVPDAAVLAEGLQNALDGYGELKEHLGDKLSQRFDRIEQALEAVRINQAKPLRQQHASLASAWNHADDCPECSVDKRNIVNGIKGDTAKSKRWRAGERGKYPWNKEHAGAETTNASEAEEWWQEGYDVDEISPD